MLVVACDSFVRNSLNLHVSSNGYLDKLQKMVRDLQSASSTNFRLDAFEIEVVCPALLRRCNDLLAAIERKRTDQCIDLDGMIEHLRLLAEVVSRHHYHRKLPGHASRQMELQELVADAMKEAQTKRAGRE